MIKLLWPMLASWMVVLQLLFMGYKWALWSVSIGNHGRAWPWNDLLRANHLPFMVLSWIPVLVAFYAVVQSIFSISLPAWFLWNFLGSIFIQLHLLIRKTSFSILSLSTRTQLHFCDTDLVWKIFWIIFLGDSRAAYSNWSTSSEPNLQPSAPRFSSACLTVLIPGIGIVPLEMHQFMATCPNKMSLQSGEIQSIKHLWIGIAIINQFIIFFCF